MVHWGAPVPTLPLVWSHQWQQSKDILEACSEWACGRTNEDAKIEAYIMLQLLQCVCILLYFYIYIYTRIKKLKTQARQTDGSIRAAVRGVVTSQRQHRTLAHVGTGGGGQWGRGDFQRTDVEWILAHFWPGGRYFFFLLRNEAQVVWSVKIPKLKHCRGQSMEGFFNRVWLVLWVLVWKWNGGEGFGAAGASEKVCNGYFFYMYPLMVRLFFHLHPSWTSYSLLKVRKMV